MNNSDPKSAIVKQSESLESLTKEVKHHHNIAVRSPIACGEALCKIKKILPHGQFEQYVNSKLGLRVRTAQRYMKIFEQSSAVKSDNLALLETIVHPEDVEPDPEDMTADEIIEELKGAMAKENAWLRKMADGLKEARQKIDDPVKFRQFVEVDCGIPWHEAESALQSFA